MRHRRPIALLVVMALAAAACSSAETGDPATSDTTVGTGGGEAAFGRTACRPATATTEVDLDGGEGAIELDDDLVVRVLDNGLTVYVRENDAPGGRGQLSLVVKAGSALQSDAQSGAAHFLEHMLFNGTERWPDNELIDELERFGSDMGPDINAFTSYDETVYLLDLPSVDRTTRELAVDVLHEWATSATVLQHAVEEERGVVVAERRLRLEGAQGRIGEVFEEMSFRDSPYADRSPIGTLEALEAMDREPLVRYYDDWYRPDLMAIVAVGDFDADAMLGLVEDRFGSMPPGDGPERPDLVVEPWSSPRFGVLVEAEQTTALGSVFYPVPPSDPSTGLGRRDDLIAELAFELIATRLADAITTGEAPLLSASWSDYFPTHSLTAPAIDFSATSADLHEATAAVVAELERACRHGFSEDELERALSERRTAVDQQHDLLHTKQDAEFGGDYRAHFLSGAPAPSGDAQHELDLAILDSVEVGDVMAWFGRLHEASAPSILVVGATDEDVPTSDALAAMVDGAQDLVLEEVDGVDIDGLELMARPDGVDARDERSIEAFGGGGFDAVERTYPNGVRVILQRSPIASGFVELGASSPGGTSLLADDQVTAGQILGQVLTSSGVADHDQVTLRALLASSSAHVELWLDEEEERLAGSAAVEDVETLLALVHLYMTEPRVTDAALATAVDAALPLAIDPTTDPDVAPWVALLDARYGGEPRYSMFWDPDGLAALAPDDVRTVADDRFGGGGDFTFVLVGDFELDEVGPLVDAYLGSLPSADPEAWLDFRAAPPAGVERRTVESGSGDQSRMIFMYSSPQAADADDHAALSVLQGVVATRLREVIREDLAATYAPSVHADASDLPDDVVEVVIDVTVDPDELEDVADVVVAELASIASGEISSDELGRAIETLANDYELWNNQSLIEAHLYYAARADEDIDDFLSRAEAVRAVRAQQVVDLAVAIFDADQHIEIRLVPVAS